MATVTSQLTRIHDLEGTLTSVAIGGGAGAAANTDIFLQGAQSLGRRQSNVTLNGFLLDDGGSNDLSAADVHVGAWIWMTHYSVLTALRVRVASNSGSANYDEHIVPLTEYPSEGGWVRVWLDISRTPDATGGTALDEATARYFGPVVSLPTVGGNAANLILDAIDHTTGGLLLTGTTGVFQDFLTADEGSTTNKYGVVSSRSGIIYCRARLTLGSSSSLVFSDSSKTVVFPQQNIVADTFMGITCNLQHASTSITLNRCSFQSPGVKKGDFVVTGTTGVLSATGATFTGLRIVTLTSACSLLSCAFSGTGVITAAGADLVGSSFSGYEGTANTSLLVWNVNTDVDGLLDDTSFTKGTAATHAIELGTTSPTTVTLRGVDFSGYNASNSQNDSTIHVKRTTGTVTINLVGCSGNISYRSDGATVTLVADPVTLTITAIDSATSGVVQGAQVLAVAGTDFTGGATVTISRSGSTATVAHTSHGYATGNKVRIRGADQPEYNGIQTITVTGADAYTYSVSGTPATPATGTIKAALVVIDALTNASGQVSDTRSWSSDQVFTGRIRRGSTAPTYKAQPVSGTIDSLAGASVTASLVSDG